MNLWINEAIINSSIAEQEQSEGNKGTLTHSNSNLSAKSSFDINVASSRKATWVWVECVVVSGSAHGLFGHSSSSRSRGNSNTTTATAPLYKTRGGNSNSRSIPQAEEEILTIRITDQENEHVNQVISISRRHLLAVGNGRGVVLPANKTPQDDTELPSDLTQLTHLHEPAVVDCLRRRYKLDGWKMYTSSGPILVAINPCRNIKGLYDDNAMRMYWQWGERLANGGVDEAKKNLPPHVFGVADAAYRGMMRGLDFSRNNNILEEEKKDEEEAGMKDDIIANQSVLVSGESGAGKTVTTKFIMQYLAALSKKVDSDHISGSGGKKTSIEQRVLQSNAILESFGNARTLRNDNSSRFGKFIELRFSDRGQLMGASIDTYLLEKARIVGHTAGERSYHIFYEILSSKGRGSLSLSASERKKFFIDNKTAADFAITTSDGGKDRSRLMHNAYEDHTKMFEELRAAMNTMGFSRPEQMEIFQTICGLLHLSNLTLDDAFVDTNDGEECMLNKNSSSLAPALQLLGVSYDSLNAAVTTVQFRAVDELVKKNLNESQAIRAVQALVKGAYDCVFTLLVDRINLCIAGPSSEVETHQSGAAFIGLLDIFGFESFGVNSFEQLCINYCNESLQQQFNRFVFKLEQQEYQREGIKWDMIQFEDNQDILDLIEARHGGILTTLDEQCKLGMRCNDKTFVSAVYKKCMTTSKRFDANKKQQSQGKFCIEHYAGLVEYDTNGFMEKNKDEIPMEASELFSNSSCAFIQDVSLAISAKTNGTQINGSSKRNAAMKSSISRTSVGGQFKGQLLKLRKRIDETSPHYVRCLKPNDQLQPNSFDPHIVVDQLRCGGILEAIRVSRAGFPHRYTFEHFDQRFSLLAISLTPRSEATKQQHRPRRVVGKLNLGNKATTPGKTKKKFNPTKLKKDPKKSCESLVKTIARYIMAEKEKNKKPVEEKKPEIDSDSLSPRSFWKTQQSPQRGGNTNYVHKPVDTSAAGIQMGLTKVFLLQDTFDCIERLRGQVMSSSATKISAIVRMYQARLAYLEVLSDMRELIRRSMGGGGDMNRGHEELKSGDTVPLNQIDVNLVEVFESKSAYNTANKIEKKKEVEFEWVSIGHGRFVKRSIEVAQTFESDFVDL